VSLVGGVTVDEEEGSGAKGSWDRHQSLLHQGSIHLWNKGAIPPEKNGNSSGSNWGTAKHRGFSPKGGGKSRPFRGQFGLLEHSHMSFHAPEVLEEADRLSIVTQALDVGRDNPNCSGFGVCPGTGMM